MNGRDRCGGIHRRGDTVRLQSFFTVYRYPGLAASAQPGQRRSKRERRKLGKTRRFRTQLVFLGRSQRHSGGYDQTIYTIDDQADEPSRSLNRNQSVRNLFEVRRALRNNPPHAGSSAGRPRDHLRSPEKLERQIKRFLSGKPLLQGG